MGNIPQAERDLVFISYSRSDSKFVDRLRENLRNAGIKIWIDKTGLPLGTRNWERAIRQAIQSSYAVLWIVTPNSYESDYVQDEIAIAEMEGCLIYPIWADGDEWLKCVPVGMGKIQNIDARHDKYEKALPTIVQVLRGEQKELAIQHSTVSLEPLPPNFVPRNPYKGLQAFQEDDAGDFFGRDTIIESLRLALERNHRENQARFLVVTGPSGSGKSSLVMAGLLPRLKRGALVDSESWVYLPPTVPGSHPLDNLAITLSSIHKYKDYTTIRNALNDPSARELRNLSLELAIQNSSQRAILFIDQFEELFTQTVDEDERQQFINLLVGAATEIGSPLSIILTLRADFYDRPMNYPELDKALRSNTELVFPMSLTDLREAIERPAALPDVRLSFEMGLVSEIVFDLRDQAEALAGALPLLQFTLTQLFEMRESNQLTLASYHEIGRVSGALAKHATDTFDNLTSEERELTRILFLRLIEPSDTEQEITRRRATFSELQLQDVSKGEQLQQVAEKFVQARLLVKNQVGGVITIEVAHEALIREWQQLHDWLQEARDDIRYMKVIAADAEEWKRRGRRFDDDILYRGSVLEEALFWIKKNVPSADEQAFLDASLARQAEIVALEEKRIQELREVTERAEKARSEAEQATEQATAFAKRAASERRRLYMAAVIAALMVIAALIIGVKASNDVNEAERQVDAANQTLTPVPRTLAAAAQEITLAAGQMNTAETQLSEAQLELKQATQQIAAANQELEAVQAQATQLGTQIGNAETQKAVVDQLTVIPVTITMVAVELSDAQTQIYVSELTLTPVPPTLTAAAENVNQAQQQVGTADAQMAVIAPTLLYASPTMLALQEDIQISQSLKGTAQAVQNESVQMQESLSLSLPLAANAQIALNEGDFDLALALALQAYEQSLNLPEVPPEIERTLTDAAYAPGTVHRLVGHEASVLSVDFSPDGRIVLSGAANGTLTLWDVASGMEIRRLTGHEGTTIRSVAFHPTNERLAVSGGCLQVESSCALAEIILWDVVEGTILHRFTPYEGEVLAVAFGPDGNSLASGGCLYVDNNCAESQLILWDISNKTEIKNFNFSNTAFAPGVSSIDFHPDGSKLITLGPDGMLVWDVTDGGILEELTANNNFGKSRFSPDGLRVATNTGFARVPGEISLWNIETGGRIRSFVTENQSITSFTFSNNGKYLLAGLGNGDLVEWNVVTGEQELLRQGHTGTVYSVDFGANDRYIVSASFDRTVRLWWAVDSAAQDDFQVECRNRINQAAFGPDGKHVLIGTSCNLQLWDVVAGIEKYRLATTGAQSVAFSPDSRIAAAGLPLALESPDQGASIGIWNVTTGEQVGELIGHKGSINGLAFSPDGKYLLSGSGDASLILWDMEAETQVRQFTGHSSAVLSVDFSPDGQYIVSVADDNVLILWEVNSGREIRRINNSNSRINSVAFSPDGTMIIGGLRNSTVMLWDTATGTLIRQFRGHEAAVSSVVFSPDGKTALSGSEDQTLILWDIASGRPIRQFEGHSDNVTSVDFAPTGHVAISGSADRVLRMWRIDEFPNGILEWIPLNRYVRSLTCAEQKIYRLPLSSNCSSYQILSSNPTQLALVANNFNGQAPGVVDTFASIDNGWLLDDSDELAIARSFWIDKALELYLEDNLDTAGGAHHRFPIPYSAEGTYFWQMKFIPLEVNQGGWFGIGVQDNDGSGFYSFTLSFEDNSWQLTRYSNVSESWETIQNSPSEVIDASQPHQLGVFVTGERLSFYIDSQPIIHVQIDEASTGFLVRPVIEVAESGIIRVVVDDLNIWQLDEIIFTSSTATPVQTFGVPNYSLTREEVEQKLQALGIPTAAGTLVEQADELILGFQGSEYDFESRLFQANYTDFIMGAAVSWNPDADCGFIFRRTENSNFYTLRISPGQEIRLLELTNNEWGAWISHSAQAVLENNINEFILVAQGNTFAVFINGQEVALFEDVSDEVLHHRGQVGIMGATGNGDEALPCHFTNIWVWQLNTIALAPTATPSMSAIQPTITPTTTLLGSTSTSESIAQERFDRGEQHFAAGEYDIAIQEYTKAIELYPTFVMAYIRRGDGFRRLNLPDIAIADYTRAITIDPQNFTAYNNRGDVYYYNLGNAAAALSDYDEALKINANNANIYNDRANVHKDLQNWEAALSDYNKAIELDPDWATPYLGRGITYQNQGKTVLAAEDYLKWIMLNHTGTLSLQPLETLEVEMSEGQVYHVPIHGEAGQTVSIRAESSSGDVDPLIVILSPEGNPINGDDDSGGELNALISDYELPVTGVYTLVISHAGGGSTGNIIVTIENERTNQ